MMENYIDARGKPCPMPLIMAKEAAQNMESGRLTVAVDNEIAVQNLTKMARQEGYGVSCVQIDERHYDVTMILETGAGDAQKDRAKPAVVSIPEHTGADCPDCIPEKQTVVAAIGSDRMGEGDETLGKVLMKGFLYALSRLEERPDIVLCYNSGAYLTCEDSDSLEDLECMEEAGTAVYTCGTCLNHYGLEEKLAVGRVTNMYEIAETLVRAGKVIKP